MVKSLHLLTAILICSAISSQSVVLAQTMDNSLIKAVADHVNRGNNLMRARQYQSAMAEYEAAKGIDPKNTIVKTNIAECFNNIGISMFRQKSYSDAIVQFEHCLEVNPRHPQAKRNIDLCHQRMDIEGIPDTPSEQPDDRQDKKKASADSEKDKKEDGSTKVSGSDGGGVSVSSGGSKMYVSGSQMFPTYSDRPSAVTSTAVPTNKPDAKSFPKAVAPDPNQTSPDPTAAGGLSAATKPALATKVPSSAATVPAVDAFDSSSIAPNPSTPAVPAAPTSSSPASANLAAPLANPSRAASTSGTPTDSAASSISHPSYAQSQLTPASSSDASGNQTLDEKVGALELKVYGHKNSSTPIMKRIEQLEIDYVGQPRQGAMDQRIEYLKKAISHD